MDNFASLLLLLMSLMPLPESKLPWSPNIRNAFRELNGHYMTIYGYVQSGSVEPHRLKRYGATIMTTIFPLLLLLEQTADKENLPLPWLEDTANKFVEMMSLLDDHSKSAHERCVYY